MADDVSAALVKIWVSLGKMLLEVATSQAEKFGNESENYFAQKMIWGVGAGVGHAASKHWMKQTVAAAAAATFAAAAAFL